MTSPMGEMFDHMCDSVSLTFCTLLFAGVLRLGPQLSCVALAAMIVPFYVSHWVDYNTNKLIMGRFGGPTDLLVMLIGVLVATGIFGSNFWLYAAGNHH